MVPDESQHKDQRDTPEFSVTYYGAQIRVSEELLADYIPDFIPTSGPRVIPTYTPTRRERVRWWVSRNVTAIRLRVGSWVAGVDLGDDWP